MMNVAREYADAVTSQPADYCDYAHYSFEYG